MGGPPPSGTRQGRTHSSDARHESRGSLKRLDFPERDDEHFLAHSMVNASGQISWQPVHIVNMPPKAREY